ncbi:MAG TPA: hypothetical protein VGG13_02190 [Candidatus Saccharimonadales bacterium]|jgi:tetratricopeptide (TPR) repeat protein
MSASNDSAKPHTVVMDSPKTFRSNRKQYRVWLTILAVIILVILGFVIWHWSHRPTPVKKVTESDLNSLGQEADAAIQNNNVSQALAIYDQAIPNAANKSVLGELDLEAADIASNAQMPSKALHYALGADAIQASSDTSALVASIYQQQGNDAKAIDYYKKASGEVSPNQISGDGSAYYLSEAQQLSGGKK